MITIDMWEGKDRETKRKLLQSVSKAVAESLEIPKEHVHIVIHEESKDNWGLHGDQASRIE